MNPTQKRVFAVLLILWVIPVAVALALGFWVSHAGMIAVQVNEREHGGGHVSLKLPAAIVLATLPFVPDVVCEEAGAEVEEWGPIVRVLCDELKDMHDGVLVEVSGRRENVSIVKKGGHLVVDCKSDGETVHVSLPIGTVSAVLAKFEGCGTKWHSRIDTHRIVNRTGLRRLEGRKI
jgi:hypothetical protein